MARSTRLFDQMPLGSVVQSPIDLEIASGGKWVLLDGRDMVRSNYPEIQAYYPLGVFTTTAVTLGSAPGSPMCIAADTTNFVCPGAIGATALQASANGSSWTVSSTWAASTQWTSIIVAGTRWVIAGNGGDAVAPYVYSTNNTAANTTTKANWTATTSGTTTTLTEALSYGATANGGLGRTVMIKNGSLGTASGIFYLNDGATAWSAASGGSTATRNTVTWTGSKFIAFCSQTNLYQTSSNGAVWSDAFLPFPTVSGSLSYASITSCASDGMGTVVGIAGTAGDTIDGGINQYFIIVTQDHGATWKKVPAPSEVVFTGLGNWTKVQYVNSKFILSGGAINLPILVSTNGVSWQVEPAALRALVSSTVPKFNVIAYKGTTYLGIGSTTSAGTALEDTSKFRLTAAVNSYNGSGVNISGPITGMAAFMKAKS